MCAMTTRSAKKSANLYTKMVSNPSQCQAGSSDAPTSKVLIMMPIGARFVVFGKIGIDLQESYWFELLERENAQSLPHDFDRILP
jgi:hypothetical protein